MDLRGTVLIGKTFSATFAIIILSLSLSCRLFPAASPNQAGLEFLYLCDHIVTTPQLRPHAYNAEQGLRKLTSYLHPESKRPEEFALAAVHTATLLDVQKRDAILKFSGSHPNSKVVFLTRVTRASLGDLDEQKLLRERCLDLTCSHETQLKLTEVGMESLIPEEAKIPSF